MALRVGPWVCDKEAEGDVRERDSERVRLWEARGEGEAVAEGEDRAEVLAEGEADSVGLPDTASETVRLRVRGSEGVADGEGEGERGLLVLLREQERDGVAVKEAVAELREGLREGLRVAEGEPEGLLDVVGFERVRMADGEAVGVAAGERVGVAVPGDAVAVTERLRLALRECDAEGVQVGTGEGVWDRLVVVVVVQVIAGVPDAVGVGAVAEEVRVAEAVRVVAVGERE